MLWDALFLANICAVTLFVSGKTAAFLCVAQHRIEQFKNVHIIGHCQEITPKWTTYETGGWNHLTTGIVISQLVHSASGTPVSSGVFQWSRTLVFTHCSPCALVCVTDVIAPIYTLRKGLWKETPSLMYCDMVTSLYIYTFFHHCWH